jgi:Uncharacterized conserved protein
MLKDIYNKLVRDKIPDIILAQGDTPKTKLLSEKSYYLALNEKLKEELKEYLADGSVEELADMAEVILALAKFKGFSQQAFEEMRLKKQTERGGFDKRIYLVEVERKS